ncbi:RHS repeat-associated core domain-containing protein, partial [Pseudomonas sp. H9]|uniref:RHS repeat-associated core domain-containing protein n=1 Tax=Pseudomonas sp. H9 TaxID=483968 RepID=UPI0010DBC8CA
HPSWGTPLITLHYDDCGRLVSDSLGRSLTWDAQDRLTHVEFKGKTCAYGYDPSGNLCDRVVDGQLSRSFFSAGQTTHEQTGTTTVQHISDGASLFALNSITSAILLGQDAQGSVRIEADSEVRSRHYTAHGAESGNSSEVPYGYTGERREPLTGWYIPAGYRPYDPLMMMFLSPDSESPFGRGGINPYAYCGGDPVNRIDPDGHDWQSFLISGIGMALGLIGAVVSLGAFAPALLPASIALMSGSISGAISMGVATFSVNLTASTLMTVASAGLSAISLGTGVASSVLDVTQKSDLAVNILGWVSLVTTIPSSVQGHVPKWGLKLTSQTRRLAGRAVEKISKHMSTSANRANYVAEQLGNTELYFPSPLAAYMPTQPSPSGLSRTTTRPPSSQRLSITAAESPTSPTLQPSSPTPRSSLLPAEGPGASGSVRYRASDASVQLNVPSQPTTHANVRARPARLPNPITENRLSIERQHLASRRTLDANQVDWRA